MEYVNKLDELILQGAVEVAGLDPETGHFLYNFTPQLKKVDPELFSNVNNHFHHIVMTLWEKGFVDIDKIETIDPVVKLTDKHTNVYEVEKLSKPEKVILENIVRQFSSH
jgi:hypothetical protein